MDSQDHKTTTATSAVTEGHESHGAHICRRCGWPFPNPHPSAKHRRAHKKDCGTIEGYKIVQSEDDDTHLAVNVDEQVSDDDAHSPSPKLVKENSSEANDGIGEKANKSENDTFSDAATGFSDSGLSQRSEESFEVVTGKEKNTDHKGKDDTSQLPVVDENAEKTEQPNDLKNSSQMCDPGAINADVQFEHFYLSSIADLGNAPLFLGFRNPIVKDYMLDSEPVKFLDNFSEPISANEQVVADSVQLTDSINTAGEKARAKEGHEYVEACVDSTSIKNSDADNKEMDNNAMESIRVGGSIGELEHISHFVTTDGTFERASSKELMPFSSESTEVSDELSKVLAEHVDLEKSSSNKQEALHANQTCTDDALVDKTGHKGEDVGTFDVIDSRDSHETRLISDDKIIDNSEQNLNVTVDETKSQSSDVLITNKEEQKVKDIEAEVSVPPSYMGLVQLGAEVNGETLLSESKNSRNNQQPKSTVLQVGSFPSVTNVANESEGITKNEEIIDKVIECSPEIQHSPLKAHLNEFNSPNIKCDQIDEAKFKEDAARSTTTVKSILDQEAAKDQETSNDADEGNSPERYLIENTKEKKKTKKKQYWFPFMCCSSVHRDL